MSPIITLLNGDAVSAASICGITLAESTKSAHSAHVRIHQGTHVVIVVVRSAEEGVELRDDAIRKWCEYLSAPTGHVIDKLVTRVDYSGPPTPPLEPAVYSVRQEITKTDLPHDMSSADAIRNLWRRVPVDRRGITQTPE